MSESRLVEAILDFCHVLESAAVGLRKQLVGLEVKVGIPEETFIILNWQDEKGVKLRDYQVAHKNNNILDKWNHAFQILRVNNSVISNRFQEKGYIHTYWIFPEKYSNRIFRKKRCGIALAPS